MRAKISGRWRSVVAVIRDLQGMTQVVYQVQHGMPKLAVIALVDVEMIQHPVGS